MRPTTKAVTGVANSAWIPLDHNVNPFNVGFGVVVSGTVTYTVEHTFDDVQDPDVTPIAFPHASVTGKTTNQDGNYAFPVRAVRLSVTAGTGTATLTVIQAGGSW